MTNLHATIRGQDYRARICQQAPDGMIVHILCGRHHECTALLGHAGDLTVLEWHRAVEQPNAADRAELVRQFRGRVGS